MKKLSLIIILSVITYGCDPGYGVYIINRSERDLILKTNPSIESLYMEESIFYDTILAHKIKSEGSLSIYKLRPYEQFKIFGHIGKEPTLSEVPFSHIEIIQEGDTIILDTKKKIMESLIKESAKKYIINKK
jgi:hypothetical protein